MSESYLYKFEHPDRGIMYIGKARDRRCLDQRIQSHLKCNADNIDRMFEEELNASDIYCMALPDANPTELNIAESILINKYKPICNKADKYEGNSLNVTLAENWEVYTFPKQEAGKKQRKTAKEKEHKMPSVYSVWGHNACEERNALSDFLIDTITDACQLAKQNVEVEIKISDAAKTIGIEYPFINEHEEDKLYILLTHFFSTGYNPTLDLEKLDSVFGIFLAPRYQTFETAIYTPEENKITYKFTEGAYKYFNNIEGE